MRIDCILKSRFSVFGFISSIAFSLYSSLALAEYPAERNIQTDFALLTTIVGNPSFIQDATNADYYDSRRAAAAATHCIFSERGHFYWKIDGKTFDSYTQGWQREGSANFCQTFAQMGYLGEDNTLEKGAPARLQNARIALQYWADHAQLILSYWPGVIEVLMDEYPYEYGVFSRTRKPNQKGLKALINEMSRLSDEDLSRLITTEEIE